MGIHSDAATAHKKVADLPDLQAILDKQQAIADATATIVEATRTYSADRAAQADKERQETREQAEEAIKAQGEEAWAEYSAKTESEKRDDLIKWSAEYAAADDKAQSWGIGDSRRRAVNAVTAAITGVLGGQTNTQIVTNALAPYASSLIGQQFGHGEDQNAAAQLVSHTILGAIVASANGGNAVAGAAGATASELAAHYLISQLPKDQYPEAINPETGEIDPNRLPESVKANIRDLSSAIAAVTDGISGDSVANAQIAAVVGQNTVENNDLLLQLNFAVKHPVIANSIGSVNPNVDTDLNPNISTITSTFQLNLFNINDLGGIYTKQQLNGEGGVGNAHRHALWQAIIASNYGQDIVFEIGNAHESYTGIDYSKFTNLSLQQADELADQLNNRIGRAIAQSNSGQSNKQLADKVLAEFSSNGLYQAIMNENGKYSVKKVVISNYIYQKSKQKLNTLDRTGAGPKIQQKRNQIRKNIMEWIGSEIR